VTQDEAVVSLRLGLIRINCGDLLHPEQHRVGLYYNFVKVLIRLMNASGIRMFDKPV
jgi:hypothetical protein